MVEGSQRSRARQRTIYCSAWLRSLISGTLDALFSIERVVFRRTSTATTCACRGEKHTNRVSPPAPELIATCGCRQRAGSCVLAHLSLRRADGVTRIRCDLLRARARASKAFPEGVARVCSTMHQPQ